MEQSAQAGEEIRFVLEGVARRRRTIYYSDLVPKIASVHLEPDSDLLAKLLDDISTSSNEAKGVMLSAVVIRKGAEPMPGPGFFKLAQNRLGRTVGPELSDRLTFHTLELQAVHTAYAI